MRSSRAEVSMAIDPEEIRRAAQDILGRPEFDEPSPTLIDRVEEALADLLGRILSAGGSGPGAIIPWLLVAALIAGTVWLVVRYAGPVGATRRMASPGLEFGTEAHRPADEWLSEAASLAAAGDFRGALRCRHQAVIATWISGDRLDHVPGRTAADCHRAALGDADGSTRSLSGSVVDRFAGAWYGAEPVDAAAYRQFDHDCTRLAEVDAP